MQGDLAVERLHFAYTVTSHQNVPQLTMGLALPILQIDARRYARHSACSRGMGARSILRPHSWVLETRDKLKFWFEG